MGFFRRLWIRVTGAWTWRRPTGPVRLMTAFSQAERGSAYDVIAALEETDRRELRRTYLFHALDEARHARIFRDRVQALGRQDRAQAALTDSGSLRSAGIIGEEPLFQQMGELEFLAFVFVVESLALEQFNVYCDHAMPDPDTTAALRAIANDEKFHISYSRRELEKYRAAGRGAEVRAALFKVRARRVWQAWLRLSRRMGDAVSTLWLWLLYLVGVGPFRLMARVEGGGWRDRSADPRPLSQFARSQG